MTASRAPGAPEVAVRAGCRVGEGVLWDEAEATVYWVDIKHPSLHAYLPATARHDRWHLPERIGFIVRRRGRVGFVGGFKSGLVTLVPGEETIAVERLADYVPAGPDDRINDGVVDAAGRLWFGSIDDRELEATGYLHLYEAGGKPQRRDGPYVVTNGPCFSPDGATLYHVDTMGRTIWAFDMKRDGQLENKRPFVRFEEPDWGWPDGLAADSEGFLWVCHWGGARITRFAPDGRADLTVPFPTPQITKCAFGGADYRTLWVTSATIGLDCTKDLLAGSLFRLSVPVRGMAAQRFAG